MLTRKQALAGASGMKKEGRIERRVNFDQGVAVAAVAIDGTWSIKGRLCDISASGAKLRPLAPVAERMRTEEFFLFLTPDKKVNRRAKLVWDKKGQVGLRFVKPRED